MAETSLQGAMRPGPTSAQMSAHASRPSSRPRAGSPQLNDDPTRRRRSPNDVRLKAPTPDVMSSLIDSFNSISQIGDEQLLDDNNPISSPRTPQKRSRASSARRGTEPIGTALPDPTSDFAEYKYPSRDIVIEPTAPEDAAEPPIVRTSRRPSANNFNPNKPFRQSSSRPGSSHGSQAPSPGPPTGRLAPPSAWNYVGEAQPPSSGRASLEQTGKDRSRRNSLKLWSRSSKTSSRAGSGTTTPQIEVVELRTGMKPASIGPPSPVAVTSVSPIARAEPISPTVEQPSYEAPARALNQQANTHKSFSRPVLPRARIEELPPTTSAPEPSSFQKRYSSEQVFKKILSPPKTPTRQIIANSPTESREEEVAESSASPNLSSPEDRNLVPNRTSSLQQTSPPDSPERPRTAGGGAEQGPLKTRDADDDEEIEALRRVRELKAAKEERRRSLQSQSAPDISKDLVVPAMASNEAVSAYPLRMNPPVSTMASRQLEATKQVNEQTILTSSNVEVPPPPPGTTLPGKQSMETNGAPKESQAGIKSLKALSARPSNDGGRTKSLVSSRSMPKSQKVSVPASPRQPSRSGKNSARVSHDIERERESLDEVSKSVAEFLSAPRLSQHMHLFEEERNVAFSEVGDPNGFAVFCCVGMGLTRYITAFYDELATSLNLRLITLDRPGIGQSSPYIDGYKPPLSWPDDVRAICLQLNIRKFSLLAHSAGAIYALATALRMPQHIHGRIHLLAPWIPPSQMSNESMPSKPRPTGSIPKTQRLLRLLPTSFFKLSNSSFMNSSLSSKKSSKSPKTKNSFFSQSASPRPSTSPGPAAALRPHAMGDVFTEPSSPPHISAANFSSISIALAQGQQQRNGSFTPTIPHKSPGRPSIDNLDRQKQFDAALTPAIWELSTRNANPAVDLIVCLERNQPIGFRYADILRPVVIHHGSKDARVPIENAKWLGKTMKKAEVRVLDGEGHGLMARAGVMGSVLTELGKEWTGDIQVR